MLVQKQDIVLKGSDMSAIIGKLADWVGTGQVAVDQPTHTYRRLSISSKLRLDLEQVVTSFAYVGSEAQATNSAKLLLKSFEHANYIGSNPEVLLPALDTTSRGIETAFATVKHAGIESRWQLSDVVDLLSLKPEFIDRELNHLLVRDEENTSLVYLFKDNRFSNSFIGDATQGILQRAWFLARREAIREQSEMYWREMQLRPRVGDDGVTRLTVASNSSGLISPRVAVYLNDLLDVFDRKPAIIDLKRQRSNLLRTQESQQQKEENIRRQLNAGDFTAYWDNMKARVRAVAPKLEVAAEQFATIPLLPEGTTTQGRTWGIEVETVRANLCERPPGWESVYDGSLSSSGNNGSCDCSCDGCYEGDHCNDRDDSCYDGADDEVEGREFVSPVLEHFNSRGLRMLCDALPDDEDDPTPGIHVHVGARDLSVTDVARLLAAYSAIEPLFKPLYHRQTYGYCAEMASNNIRWWLGAARKYLREQGTLPRPSDICELQPANRYQDVNVHALEKHGTIEFRAMGPYYNYDHLVRWAWVCRELVNISKLGLPQDTWTKCRSVTDVIKVLRRYGLEMPSDKQFDAVDTRELALSLLEE